MDENMCIFLAIICKRTDYASASNEHFYAEMRDNNDGSDSTNSKRNEQRTNERFYRLDMIYQSNNDRNIHCRLINTKKQELYNFIQGKNSTISSQRMQAIEFTHEWREKESS